MKTKGSRSATLLALLLLTVPSLLPGAQAHHATRADSDADAAAWERLPVNEFPQALRDILLENLPRDLPGPDDVPIPDPDRTVDDRPRVTPTVDDAIGEIAQRQRDVVRDLQNELIRRNMSPEGFIPSVVLGARAFEDHLDPGKRIGGIGDWRATGTGNSWRVINGIGTNESAALSILDPATGRYGTMDAILVTPAIDLSAYLVETGTYPFAGGSADENTKANFCNTNPPRVPIGSRDIFRNRCTFEEMGLSSRYVQDQVVLLFRHRHNFLPGEDGGQVLVYTKDPATGGKPILVYPMAAYGRYSEDPVRSLGSDGFTGYAGWNVTAVDLTPWAGHTVWIGFRAATTPRASSDPNYFSASAFPNPGPPGWIIDDVHVYADAYGRNLKVYSVDGPHFRTHEKDPYDRVPPGKEFNVTITALNAGAARTHARVEIVVDGRVVRDYVRELESGEVWNFTAPVIAPTEDGREFNVEARIRGPGPNGLNTTTDLKTGDNSFTRTFVASAFAQFQASLVAENLIVDDNQPQTVTALVANTGNVPVQVGVDLWELFHDANTVTGIRDIPMSVTHPSFETALDIGESVNRTWPVTTSVRGAHVVTLNVTGAGVKQTLDTTYYVHASPPPVFSVAGGDELGEGWRAVLTHSPIDPVHGWIWALSETIEPANVLAARPLPEAIQAASAYKDLKLTVRYFAPYRANFSIGYPSPVDASISVVSSAQDPTHHSLWYRETPAPTSQSHVHNLTWITDEWDVEPRESGGYHSSLWGLNSLEVRVRVPRSMLAFFLDELLLTGVPDGGDESHRRDLVRITGDESIDGVHVYQPIPSTCKGVVPVDNCWIRVNANQLEAEVRNSRWRSLEDPVDGREVVFQYFGPPVGDARPDRLITPVINLGAAVDPLVFLDHSYAFQGFPTDNDAPIRTFTHQIKQYGFAEVQYLRDDGNWSDFIRILPVGGYRDLLKHTDDGLNERSPNAGGANTPNGPPENHLSGRGFFQPSRCREMQVTKDMCDMRGFTRSVVNGIRVWRLYEPSPLPEVSVFRLKDALPDVNLTERPIRLALHMTNIRGAIDYVEESRWNLMGLRVTPVSRFATDALVANLSLETTYDWQKLGVAPGSVVPVNVTVRNDGIFGEDWSVRLSAVPVGKPADFSKPVRVGTVAPAENRSVTIEWKVPDGENVAYALVAEVVPTDISTVDDNRYNNRLGVGQDLSLYARTVRNVALGLTAFPAQGDVDVIRYLPVTLRNLGNVPLADLRVTRLVERLGGSGAETVDQDTWTLTKPLVPDAKDVSLTLVASGVRDSDLSYVPDAYGTYLVSVNVRGATGPVSGDATPEDNSARAFVDAIEPLYSENFDGRTRWHADDPEVWGDGPGFRSVNALTAANRTTGLIPAGTDASAVSVKIPLSNARTGVVNFVTRYDLEQGYDGVVVEVSPDNRTWHRAGILGRDGRTGPYPVQITQSNPLANGVPPDQNVTAFSGSSTALPLHVDGWAPISIDLASVPALSELVVFKSLNPPDPKPQPVIQDPVNHRVSYAPWFVEDPGDPAGRWEIRNEAYRQDGRSRFWSGMTDPTGVLTKSLSRTFPVEGTPSNAVFAVSWWDRRPGTLGDRWEGVGAKYTLRAYSNGVDQLASVPIELVAKDGSWYRLRAVLPATTPRDLPLTLSFDMTRTVVSATNTGWEVRDVTLQAVPALGGRPIPGAAPLKTFTGNEASAEEQGQWMRNPAQAWAWVPGDKAVPEIKPAAPWAVTVAKGPDSRPRALWNLGLAKEIRANVDTRLVSPVIDLADVGGGETKLRMTHKYNLSFWEEALPRNSKLNDSKFYQGGTVEIEVFNRTTGQWDKPRQLFTDPAGPSRSTLELPPRTFSVHQHHAVTDAAPYTKTFLDAGDTFERYPRRYLQEVKVVTDVYFRHEVVPAAYVFSGSSYEVAGHKDGWLTHEFDLSPYRGERVRVAFHAWSGPVDRNTTFDRYWSIAQAEVVGNVLSTSDVWMRFRLGTDGSGLTGSFAADQFEVSGRRYLRSVGIEIDEPPTTVASDGAVTISGRIQNYGRGIRDGVGIGLQISSLTTGVKPKVIALGDTPSLIAEGYSAAGPYLLGPAGTPESVKPFKLQVQGVAVDASYRFRLVVLEAQAAGGAVAYAPAKDDVPGRAMREWAFTINDNWRVRIDEVAATPSYLDAPADVRASVRATNTGTKPLELRAEFTWINVSDRSKAHQITVPAADAKGVDAKPGQTVTITAPAFRPPAKGNYTIQVQLLNGSAATTFEPGAHASRLLRIGQGEVLYSTSFEDGLEGWMSTSVDTIGGVTENFDVVEDEARFGNRSILFGRTNAEYERGQRLNHDRSVTGALPSGGFVSPVIDLTGSGPEPVLTFWQKISMETYSYVRVSIQRTDRSGSQLDPSCHQEDGPEWYQLPPSPAAIMSGRTADWQQVRVPLSMPGCVFAGGYVVLRLEGWNGADQGWRFDGITITSGEAKTTPLERTHVLADGVRKTYFYVVENRGLVPKDVEFSVDRNRSTMTNEEAKHVSLTPTRAIIPPGGMVTLTVAVEVPSQRGLFVHPINVTVAMVEKDTPFVANLTRLNLDFAPGSRADLAAVASIDGKPLGSDRVMVEEGTPHEIGVLVSNLGAEASRPTDVVLRIVDASGHVTWQHRERIEGLLPVGEGGEAMPVSASWLPPFSKRGNHTLEVAIDPARLQIDLDRSNSELSLPLAVTALIRPDLVVDGRSLRVSTPDGTRLHEAVPGQLVRISGLVRNDGLSEARQVTIRIIAGSSILKEEIVPVLKAGDGYVVSTNQIAPPTTTTYQIVAITPDLEIFPDNNAQLLELPILPPELVVGAPGVDVRVKPGDRLVVPFNLSNTAPYPTVVNLSMGAGARFGTLSATRVALGPGETRNLTLTLEPSARETAGEGVATILAESTEGIRTRRTMDVTVEAVPSVEAVTYVARGPPQDVRLEMDAVNTGNVELRPKAVVRDANGAILLTKDLPALPPGKARFQVLSLKLPDATPPGVLPVTLSIEADGKTLGSNPVDVLVEPWGRLLTRATPLETTGQQRVVTLTVTYEGNAPTVRQPVVMNAPPGVVARYSEESLTLSPGETRNVTLRIATPRASPEGLWLLQAGFLDPATGATTLIGNLTSIPLDLRQARAELSSARRVSAEAPSGGGPVDYVARVRNTGDRDSGSIPVDLYVDGALVDRQLVEALAPGEVREVRLTYNAEPGSHAVVLAVDPHGPHRDKSPAFAETLLVAGSPISGVPGLQEVPAPSALVLLMALVLLAGIIRRRGPPR